MNTPNPLIPQGSLERQSKGKSTVRIAIFTIISIHAVFFAGLLMQGCRRDEAQSPIQTAEADTNQNTLAPLDPGYYPAAQDISAVQTPVPVPAAIPPVATEPSMTLPPATAPEVEGKPYTIAKGDTLVRIAKLNRITVGALSRANPSVDPSKLRPGQRIHIPAPTAPSASDLGYKEPVGSENLTGSGNLYTVKPGETLTRIAKRNGTTIKAIRAANNLKTDRLHVGQKLKLPAATATSAAAESPKNGSVSRLTATNPAHVTPVSETNMR